MGQPSKLMNRNFFLLWQGQLISQIGNQVYIVAMLFWIKQMTGSATLMGLIMMASALPSVLLGPIGGTFADRYPRRTIIICSDILSGLAVLSLASFMFIAPGAINIILCWLFVVSTIVAIVNSFFKPAITAAIPDLVPEDKIASGNSLNEASIQIATLLGQGAGGVLFGLLGAPLLFLINGLSYFFSAVSESLVKIPQSIPKKSTTWQETFREFQIDTVAGFDYVWSRPGIRAIFMAAAPLNIFAVTIFVLLPFYVEDFLKVGADWYGFLWAAFGLGSLAGYVLASIIKSSGNGRSNFLAFLVVCTSVAFSTLGFVSIPWLSLVVMAVIGMTIGIINVTVITILQITTPSEIRGRVFGLLGTIAHSLSPMAMGIAGIVADLTNHNIPLIYTTCGGILFLVSVSLSLNQKLHNFLAEI